eukprot:scaffold103143_cov13-Tisochrysis_lutea.AAC.1
MARAGARIVLGVGVVCQMRLTVWASLVRCLAVDGGGAAALQRGCEVLGVIAPVAVTDLQPGEPA